MSLGPTAAEGVVQGCTEWVVPDSPCYGDTEVLGQPSCLEEPTNEGCGAWTRGAVLGFFERFDIELFSDFSAK